MNPYHVLGLEQATAPSLGEIHAAYRKLAKTKHPDAGGHPAEWERLQLAYAVLSDEESRKKYDATGDITLGSCDNSLAEMLNIIAHAVEQIRAALDARGLPASRLDWLTELRQQITADRRERHAELQSLYRVIEALRGRYNRTPIAGEERASPDVMALLVQHYQRQADHLREKIAHFDKATDRALEELSRYVTRSIGQTRQIEKQPFSEHGWVSKSTSPWSPI